MIWRRVTEKNVKDLQSFSLAASALLGAAFTWHAPPILDSDTSVIRGWGTLLFVCALVGIAGEVWSNYGKSEKRWLVVFGAHCTLTAIYSALGVYAILSIGPDHPGALVLTILFTEAAWLHRAFVHWKSDVDEVSK